MAAEGEEIDDIQEDEWYLNRLEAGLSALQSADYVLAWICMEDDGVSGHTSRRRMDAKLLNLSDQSSHRMLVDAKWRVARRRHLRVEG